MCHHGRTSLCQGVAAEEPSNSEMQRPAIITKLPALSEVGIMLMQAKGWRRHEQIANFRFGRSA